MDEKKGTRTSAGFYMVWGSDGYESGPSFAHYSDALKETAVLATRHHKIVVTRSGKGGCFLLAKPCPSPDNNRV